MYFGYTKIKGDKYMVDATNKEILKVCRTTYGARGCVTLFKTIDGLQYELFYHSKTKKKLLYPKQIIKAGGGTYRVTFLKSHYLLWGKWPLKLKEINKPWKSYSKPTYVPSSGVSKSMDM